MYIQLRNQEPLFLSHTHIHTKQTLSRPTNQPPTHSIIGMLAEIEKATKLKRRHITSTILAVASVLVYFFLGGIFFSFVNVVLTTLIPLYLSFESLPCSSNDREDNKGTTGSWLGYWIVYITFELVLCVLSYLASNFADAWWVLEWIFIVVRFVVLSCLVIGDDVVRDAFCREALYPMRNSLRKLNLSSGSSRSHNHHHHHKNSGVSLEEGGSISSVVTNQQQTSSVSADIYQRKTAAAPLSHNTTTMT
jgi:hypothetical protein